MRKVRGRTPEDGAMPMAEDRFCMFSVTFVFSAIDIVQEIVRVVGMIFEHVGKFLTICQDEVDWVKNWHVTRAMDSSHCMKACSVRKCL